MGFSADGISRPKKSCIFNAAANVRCWVLIPRSFVVPEEQQESQVKRNKLWKRKRKAGRPLLRPAVDLDTDAVFPPVETAEALDISLSTLRRLWKRGEGPPRIQLSPRRTGSRGRGILQYLRERGAV
jgi:hypothetical protein